MVRMHGGADNDDEYVGNGRGAGAGGDFFVGGGIDSPLEETLALSDRG